jgi:hypothetical protein
LAAIKSVVSAVARAFWRDLRSLESITGNNFFLFVLVLMQQPASASFFLLILAVLFLVPISTDPLRKIPKERLALWPLSSAQLIAVRIGSAAVSPMTWITLGAVFALARKGRNVDFLVGAVGVQSAVFAGNWLLGRMPQIGLLRYVPAFPGRVGGLIRKDVREALSTLDPYVALILGWSGGIYRLVSHSPDPAALPMISMLAALALSTYAQCLFGLDGPDGIKRYKLLPLRGWQILLTKDVTFLAVLLLCIAPVSVLPGLAAGLVSLTIGHHTSVLRPIPQQRWRFTSGVLFLTGFVQVLCLFGAGTLVSRTNPVYGLILLVPYAASVAFYGLLWDRRQQS